MSGQQRVQAYLEQHKIGVLFEELMGKVISDMPEEPIIYLIRALQRKASRMGLSTENTQTRKNTDNELKSRTRSISPKNYATYPGTKKTPYGRDYEQYVVQSSPPHGYRNTWQAEGMAVPKERAYDKPWQSSAKRPVAGHPVRKSGGKPDWNADTKVKTSELDDLWGSKGEGQMKTRGRSPSPSKRGTKTSTVWAGGAVEDDQEFLYSSYGYSGPRRQETDDEIIVSQEASSEEVSEQPRVTSKKRNNQRSNTERHKQELERLILDRKKAEDSGIEEDRDLDPDDAVELMENAEDLRNEGVTEIKASSGIARRSSARASHVTAEPQVRVSICARCAKVMTGEPSTAATPSGRYGQVADYAQEEGEEEGEAFPQSRPQSAVRFSPGPGESDEEFESVSQVTGPRRPVWQDDSDAEGVTPRIGKHMFASSTVPTKGRPMFSPEAGRAAQSQDFERSASGRTYTKHEQSPFHKTWSPEVRGQFSSSDQTPPTEVSQAEQTEVLSAIEEEDTGQSTTAAGRQGGWHVHDYETDGSSFYGSQGQKGKKQFSSGY